MSKKTMKICSFGFFALIAVLNFASCAATGDEIEQETEETELMSETEQIEQSRCIHRIGGEIGNTRAKARKFGRGRR